MTAATRPAPGAPGAPGAPDGTPSPEAEAGDEAAEAAQIEEEQGKTQAQVAGALSSFNVEKFKKAKGESFQEVQAAVAAIHPPLRPVEAMEILRMLDPDRDKGVMHTIFEKTGGSIPPALTAHDGKSIFETHLLTADVQLELAGKLTPDGLQDHMLELLKRAVSDDVREKLLETMTELFASSDDVYEALKSTTDQTLQEMILDKVPKEGLSPEVIERILKDLNLSAANKRKMRDESEPRRKQSGPEAAADRMVVKPAQGFFKGIKSFFGRMWGGLKGLLGLGPKEAPQEFSLPETPSTPEAPTEGGE